MLLRQLRRQLTILGVNWGEFGRGGVAESTRSERRRFNVQLGSGSGDLRRGGDIWGGRSWQGGKDT